jgi:hypothetical protein
MGIGMLIFSIFGIADSLVDLKILDKGFLIGILYIAWGIARFFDKRKKVNYIKAIFCYVLGMFTFTFLAMMLGFLIDLLNK